MIRRAILVAACALASCPAAAEPEEPITIDEATPVAIARTVDLDRGYFDVVFEGLPALVSARYVTTDLAPIRRFAVDRAPDPSPGDAYDDLAQVEWRIVPETGHFASPRSRYQVAATASGSQLLVSAGLDTDGDHQPDREEELCRGVAGSASECTFEFTYGGTRWWYWIVTQVVSGTGAGVAVETYLLPLGPCFECDRAPYQDLATLVATGPGHAPAGARVPVRIAYDAPAMLAGRSHVGQLAIQRRPGSTVARIPVRLTRTGHDHAPAGLGSLTSKRVVLSPGRAHERLFVDVTPGTTRLEVEIGGIPSTPVTGERISLYAAWAGDVPAGPRIDRAPARDAPGVVSTTANRLWITDPAPGRWFLTPVNTGDVTADVSVSARLRNASANFRRGSYYNPARPGHGVFIHSAGGERAMLWYTYLQDGSPTWYYAQGPAARVDGTWKGSLYRAAWDGAARTLTPIGAVILSPRNDAGGLTMTYTIDGLTGSEPLEPWLGGCVSHAGVTLRVNAHWYDPATPGYGYSVQVVPGYEFLAAYVYDGAGVPRFLVAERPGPFAADPGPLVLEQLSGFAPLGPHRTPIRSPVGTLARAYGPGTIEAIGTQADFVDGVPGSWARSAEVAPLTDAQSCAW